MQQGYLCPKNQNYLLGKTHLGFFLNYGLRARVKITILGTLSINFFSK